VDITAALHEMQDDAVRVTLVAVEPGEDGGPRVSDAFAAEEIRLVTYAGAGDTGPAACASNLTPSRGRPACAI